MIRFVFLSLGLSYAVECAHSSTSNYYAWYFYRYFRVMFFLPFIKNLWLFKFQMHSNVSSFDMLLQAQKKREHIDR